MTTSQIFNNVYNKKDIFEISLSELTDEYVSYLQEMNEKNIEVASEFVVMAATLLDIKARKLLPELEESEEEEDENANDTLPPSAPTRKSLKIQDYNNGIILAENIKQVFQPNLSKESIISMIKAALNQSQAKRNRNQKRLSPKQIATIGSIIHSTLTKKGKQQRKSFAEPITHPLLKNVLVKVGLRDLTPDLLKQTCFKDKAVTNEEIKKALEDIAQGNNTSDIKVLTIEIS